MNIVQAIFTYFVLMFGTIFAWFVVGQFMVDIFGILYVAMSGDVNVQEVIRNSVISTHLTFIALLVCWTVWIIYVAHSSESEQSYVYRGQ